MKTEHRRGKRGAAPPSNLSRRAVLRAIAASAIAAPGLTRVGRAFAKPAIAPFAYRAPQTALDDLKRRLADTRWPDRETVADWSQGVPLDRLKSLLDYWRTDYDWRRCEARLNGFEQYRTEIDGLNIHFLHVRSPHADALPIIITHGWPSSIVDFLKVIEPLTNPTAHGGRAEEAFHVVVPSLPGYGFSDKPAKRGWNTARIAKAWAKLMRRLGYQRYVAQGGDWGAFVTTDLAQLQPPELAGIHLNFPLIVPDPIPTAGLSAEEQRAADALAAFERDGSAYLHLQATRPQTIGYALADSPAGQAAWIYEMYAAWTDNDGDPEDALTRDDMLDNITLYWLTNTAASSARLYYENLRGGLKLNRGIVELPVGCSIFPHGIPWPRSWAEPVYPNLIHWRELDRGGHFAAFEEPELFTEELRDCFRALR